MGERRTRGRGGGGTRARRADSAAATRSARTAGAREGRRRHRGASAREKRGRLVLPAFFLSFFFSPSSPLTQVVVLEQDGAAHPGRQRVVVVPHGRAAVGRPEGRVVRGRVGHVLFLRFCVFALSVWFGVNFFFFECWCWGGVGWLVGCFGAVGFRERVVGRADASMPVGEDDARAMGAPRASERASEKGARPPPPSRGGRSDAAAPAAVGGFLSAAVASQREGGRGRNVAPALVERPRAAQQARAEREERRGGRLPRPLGPLVKAPKTTRIEW